MKVNKLHKGQIFKNYKELCEVLEIVPTKKANNQRNAQFKELERYCAYHKEGHKIIIDIVFNEVKAKVDNRTNNKGGNNIIYAEDIESIMLNLLYHMPKSIREVGVVGYTKVRLYEKFGLVNDNYKPTNEKVLQLSDKLNLPYQSINECYNTVNGKLWNTVKSGLNRLKNRALINWDLSYNLVLIDEVDGKEVQYMRVADTYDKELIRSCELKALKDINLPTKTKVFTLKKWDEFKDIVTEYLREEYPTLVYYFESVAIRFDYSEIYAEVEGIELEDTKYLREQLNYNISNSLNKSFDSRHNNAVKNIETKEYITAYDNYRVSEEYTAEQRRIKDTIIPQKAKLIDDSFKAEGGKTIDLKRQWESKYKPTEQQLNKNMLYKQMSIFDNGFNNDIDIDSLIDDSKGFEMIDDNSIPF